MIITIKAFARFREILGSETAEEVPEGITLAGLLEQIADRNPKIKTALYEDDSTLRRYVILMQNKKRVNQEDVQTIVLSEGDEIAIYPPVAGG